MSSSATQHQQQVCSSSSSPRPPQDDLTDRSSGVTAATGHVSSDSTSNSELTSLEYTVSSSVDGGAASLPSFQDARIAQIDSLEAIINRLISEDSSEPPNDDSLVAEDDELLYSTDEIRDGDGRGPVVAEFVLGRYGDEEGHDPATMRRSHLISDVRDTSTQTLSTGDIVITKVYDD